jgi:dephospho-CoA kinase
MGCGKSTVASLLSTYEEFNVLDCDGLARQVLLDARYREEICTALGENVFTGDAVNTGAIANIVFGDVIRKDRYEKVIGPRMWQMVEVATEDPGKIHIVEMAYLFEKHLENRFSAIIAVTCNKKVQLSRLRGSRGMTEAAIAARLKFQIPQEKIVARSHFTIDTGCSFPQLEERVAALRTQLLAWKGEQQHA